MKNHLKRIAAPRTWVINRKVRKYTIRPNAGGHPFSQGLPLGIIARDVLKIAATTAETKKLLNNNDLLVDGKRRKDYRYIAGLFDVISLPGIKKSYRLLLDEKGRVCVKEVAEKETGFKLCKILGKTTIKGGKTQYHLHDGRNVLADVTANVGDTFVVELPSFRLKEVLPLKEGAAVLLTKGKYSGSIGNVQKISGAQTAYRVKNNDFETLTKYLFVVGKEKPYY